MMIHRKREHVSLIRKCFAFESDQCSFNEKSCWYNHELSEDFQGRLQKRPRPVTL